MTENIDVEWHEKVWGKEEWIANNPLYCGKILHLKAGFQTSLHYHRLKDETFYVLDGCFRLEYCPPMDFFKLETLPADLPKSGRIMQIGWGFHCPPGQIHRLIGISDAKILEISTQHFEDDSYRLTQSGLIPREDEDA